MKLIRLVFTIGLMLVERGDASVLRGNGELHMTPRGQRRSSLGGAMSWKADDLSYRKTITNVFHMAHKEKSTCGYEVCVCVDLDHALDIHI